MEGPAPRPGQLTLWAMQSVAQGADFVSFFRWRTACFGTEMYWHGILDYDNRDNRKLAEVKDFCKKLSTLDPVCGADNVAAFALIKDYDNLGIFKKLSVRCFLLECKVFSLFFKGIRIIKERKGGKNVMTYTFVE